MGLNHRFNYKCFSKDLIKKNKKGKNNENIRLGFMSQM